jgi:hypothetical protein
MPLINGINTTGITSISGISSNSLTRVNNVFIPPNIHTTNLEIHYDFTNPACYSGTGATVQDLTANNRDLTWTNAPTWNGSYFTFDGVNDYGTISNISSVNTSGTVSYWFKLTDTMNGVNQSRRISGINAEWEFGRLDPGGTVYSTGNSCGPGNLPLGSIGADLGGFNINATTKTNWPNTDWFNLVIVWDSTANNSRMYVNNVLERTCGPLGGLGRTGTWSVGRSPGNTSQYFKGNIGWMTYYSVALTAANIEKNWNATRKDYGY